MKYRFSMKILQILIRLMLLYKRRERKQKYQIFTIMIYRTTVLITSVKKKLLILPEIRKDIFL